MNLLHPFRIVGLKFIGLAGILSFALAGQLGAQTNVNNQSKEPQGNPANNAVPYNGIQKTPWYNNPQVREELKLNDDQYNQLNQSYSKSWDRYHQGLGQLNGLSDQQRLQQSQQLHNGFYDDVSKSTNSVLTDPAARERYHQLQWQYRGYGAFHDPTVQQQLNLTDAQRQKISQANQSWSRRMSTWNDQYRSDPDSVLKKFNESRPEFQEHMRTILTPQQQQSWSTMTGNPYAFPPQDYFHNGESTTTTTAKPVLK